MAGGESVKLSFYTTRPMVFSSRTLSKTLIRFNSNRQVDADREVVVSTGLSSWNTGVINPNRATLVEVALQNHPSKEAIRDCLRQHVDDIVELFVFEMAETLKVLTTALDALPNYYRVVDTGEWMAGARIDHLLEDRVSHKDINVFAGDVALYISTFEPDVVLSETVFSWVMKQRTLSRRKQ